MFKASTLQTSFLSWRTSAFACRKPLNLSSVLKSTARSCNKPSPLSAFGYNHCRSLHCPGGVCQDALMLCVRGSLTSASPSWFQWDLAAHGRQSLQCSSQGTREHRALNISALHNLSEHLYRWADNELPRRGLLKRAPVPKALQQDSLYFGGM